MYFKLQVSHFFPDTYYLWICVRKQTFLRWGKTEMNKRIHKEQTFTQINQIIYQFILN